MCGIFGSNNFSKYTSLYEINKQRGTFAFGCLAVREADQDMYIVKRPGNIDLEHLPSHVENNYDVYLGHTQAPTSNAREYDVQTSHPFEYKEWLVAHNGIINNYEKIVKQHAPKHKNPVDSSVLPVLFDKYQKSGMEAHESIMETMNQLKGLAAIWAYNKLENKLFLCRMGSTLYYDGENTFSSLKLPGTELMDDNTLYEFNFKKSKITEIDKLSTQSEFFIIE